MLEKILTLSILFLSSACNTSSSVKKEVENPAVLEFFVMSQCPYGVQVMQSITPVKELLGPNLDLQVNFIGEVKGSEFESMHGPSEVKGNIAQLCAMNLAPDSYLKMIDCQNKDMSKVDTNWETCAPEAKINTTKLASCIKGDMGKKLLTDSFGKAKARNAQGSPTIFLNGKEYRGGRKTNDFIKAICNEFTGKKPKACENIPTPPKVNSIFLSDKRCPTCDISQLESRLKNDLGGIAVTHLDYSSAEGKALFMKLRAANDKFLLPAILFDQSIEQDKEGKAVLSRFLRPIGDYQSLQIGGKFDPTSEICDNTIDDDGNGQIDCADAGCKKELVCRDEKPKNLDLFVMSECPYGARAVLAMKEVLDNFKNDLTLNIHFIAEEKNGKVESMHGQSEVDEDVRQICAIKNLSKNMKYMEYLLCRAKDYRNPNWETCAGKDAATIKKCFDGEGQKLLQEDIKLASSLGVNGSPTLMTNNRHLFNGIDAETIKQNYCKHNAGLAGCANTLSSGDGANNNASCK